MIEQLWQGIIQFIDKYGSNTLVTALVSVLLTLMAVSFKQIGSFLSHLTKRLWAIFSKRGKDYDFERAYLSWIISEHRYLGLLPARVVTTRWGEGQRAVDLEKVYVALSVSEQGGDQNGSGFYSKDTSSWRKPPRWYWMTNLMSVYVLTFFAAMILATTALLAFFSHYSFLLILTCLPFMVLILLIITFRRFTLRKETTYQLGDLALSIEKYRQLVIQGDPGSGKTTLLRYLAITCARALRNDRKQGDRPDSVKKRLLWQTRPFPILVTLRLHHDVAHWGEQKQLIDTFLGEMPVEWRKRCPEGFFKRKLARGNCLILLDAFDELGSSEARAAMAHRIGDFITTHDQPRNRIVVTTRIVGYEGQLDRYGFQIQTVQPLHAGATRALIKQRYRAIALTETAHWSSVDAAPLLREMQRRSERLIKKIESTPRLAQLATNPLLLSLIVLVHRVKLELPEERVLLYRDCIEILAEQWQRRKCLVRLLLVADLTVMHIFRDTRAIHI